MTKIEANVPDYLAKQAFAVAERESVPLDHIVALALSAQLAAWKGSDDMATSDHQGSRRWRRRRINRAGAALMGVRSRTVTRSRAPKSVTSAVSV